MVRDLRRELLYRGTNRGRCGSRNQREDKGAEHGARQGGDIETDRSLCQVAIESGSPVEWTEEVNYKFRLSSFKQHLIDWLESSPSSERYRPYVRHYLILTPSRQVCIRHPSDSTSSNHYEPKICKICPSPDHRRG